MNRLGRRARDSRPPACGACGLHFRPASAEEEVHVLVDAEPQDDHQRANVVDVSLEHRIVTSLLRLVGDFLCRTSINLLSGK